MVTSTSVDVTYKTVEGWHIFEADDMPGLYIAHRDPRRAYNAIGPAIQQLIKLDTGMDCRVAPEIPFGEFIGTARAELCAAVGRQRFNLFKEAA